MIRSSLKCAGSKRLAPNRLYAAVLLALSSQAMALPEGGEVVAGDAAISVSGDTMQVLQNSQRAILNFQSFDIASQQTVNFQQPGADAVALNRVLGDRLSEIHGALNANGQVYLINPNGVVFGNGAEINVGSLVVTTLDMADQDFLAGRDAFSGNTSGRVENQGSIEAQDRVVLLAPEVVNSGSIQVPDGEIFLRSSRHALLHTAGSAIPILVDDPDLVGRVTNQGILQAGEIALVLDGTGRGDVYDSAINNSGLVRAARASGEGGEIHLLAAGGVINSGTLDAAAEQGDGGSVSINAETINQSGIIRATAVGEGDGGRIELLATDAIAMHSGSAIDASAGQSGDAGDVVVIAEKSTWFTKDASIQARGGQEAGDGGFVEVSGHEFVSVSGAVDVGADHGEGGLWFIDPTDIRIVPSGVGADFGGAFTGSDPATWAASGSPSTASINVVTLRNTLMNNGNVRISTASGGTAQGNITFDAGLNYNGLGGLRTLTLEANGSIIFNSAAFIFDSDPSTVEGLNFFATAGTGFVLPDGASIFSHTGKIDINVLAGDATFTGLGSAANAADAIRVTANAGRLVNAGASTWNLTVPGADAGIILSGRDGIENITVGNALSANGTFVDAISSAGDVQLIGESVFRINRLSAADYAYAHARDTLWLMDSAMLVGNSFQLSSSNFIALPQSGLTVPGTLTLLGPDIVTHSAGVPGGRTLALGATDLIINTNAAGGNLQINSTVDTLSLTNGFSNTITVNDSNALTLGIIAPQAGNVIINSGAGTDLVVGTNIDLSGMAGSLTLGAGRNLLLNANIVDTDGSGITFLNALSGSVIFGATSQVNAGTGNVNIAASSNVELGRVTGGTVTINAGGSITDANGTGVNLSGTSATLTAGAGGIGSLADGLETSVGSVTLNSGGGAFLSNSQALTLSSLNINGDLNVSLPTAGNLTLTQATPTIAGSSTFSVANGQLVVPAAGWNTAGNLSVNALGVRDSDTTVSLTANNANLTLNGTAASTLNVDFNTLALQIAGGQTVQVVDANALSISNLSSNGNLTVTTGNGSDLTITDTTPVSSGPLTLNAGRNLVLPTAGLSIAGNLTILADDLSDTDTNVTLGAANADITLRNATAARSWTTSFDELVLDITGTGSFTLTDTDGLTLTSVETGGNASFTTTAADLVLTAQPQATGDLTLRTTGTGDLVVPTARFIHAGNLVIDANDLLDTNRTLTLEATAADIRLRNPGGDHNWTTRLGSLALEMGGTANIQLTDENGLTVSGLTVGGNATIGSTGADLVLMTSPVVAGDLSLTTVTSGDLVIGNTGLMHGGELIIVADNIRDSDSSITLGATNADITLRDGAQAQAWTTSFTQLALQIAGGGDFSLTDTNGLTLTSVSTGGNASFSATGADLVLTSAPNVTGALTLATVGSGDLVIPNAGLAHAGDLTITADSLRDSDADLTLAAGNAVITLRDGGAQARNWTTTFDQLILAITGTGDFNLTNTGALTLTSVTTGGNASFTTDNGSLTLGTGSIGGNAAFTAAEGDLEFINASTFAGDLSLTANAGAVIVDGSGLTVSGDLTVDADDLRDSDADVTLAATTATITLRDGGTQTKNWTTTFDELVLDITGTGDFNLTNTGALTLTSVTTGGNTTFATDNGSLTLGTGSIGGNAEFTATAGDVVITSTPTIAGDLSLTTVGSGDVIVSDAGLTVGGDLTVDADDLRDTDFDLTLAAANAAITLRDAGTQARTWTTSFDTLVLDIAGTGDFSLTNTDALILTSVTTGGNTSFATQSGGLTLGSGSIGGNAAFTAADGDLEFINAPTFAGDLSLTANAGAVIVDDAGLTVGGNLTVAADDMRDSDADVTLAATTANITLRNGGTQTRNWTTTFDELVLDITGTGDFNLTNTGDLTVTSVTTGGNTTFTTDNGNLTLGTGSIGGNAAFTATAGDLVFVSAPTIAGDLSLTTVGSGDVIVSETGLTVGGDLAVDADDLRDTDSELTLAATNANITLRDAGTQARTWTTSFDTLVLDIAGTGDFSLTNTDALILTSVTTDGNASFATANGGLTLGSGSIGGNAAFTAAAGDLLFTTAPSFAGDLSLTANAGAVIVDDAGLTVGGDLTVDADDLRDSDTDVTLAAGNATITLRDGGTQTRNWTTTFDELVLDITGTGDFNLTNTGDLTVTSVTTGGNTTFTTDNGSLTLGAGSIGGNAEFTATAGDVVITSTPTIAGDLSLTTVGSGDVIVSDAGLTVGGDLTVDADDLRDSNSDLTLAATNAAITLRNGGTQARTWTTSFDELVLDIAGTGDFALINSGALDLTAIATGGNASFATAGDLTFTAGSIGGNAAFTANDGDITLTAAPTVGGNLTLTTAGSGDVIVPAAGLSVGGDLTIAADNLRDSDSDVILDATNANITLRQGAADRTWSTSFDSLTLNIIGSGDFALSNSDSLTLTSVATGGNASFTTEGDLTFTAGSIGGNAAFTANDGDITLTTVPTVAGDLNLVTVGSGDVIVPVTGIAVAGNLIIAADDLRDDDSDVTLAATNADITLRGGSQAQTWSTSFDSLVLDIAGAGDFALADSDGLTLTSVTTGGNASFSTTNADLELTATPDVAGDLTLVTIGSGDLIIPDAGLLHTGALTVNADYIVANGGVRLGATDANITLRGGDLAQSWATSFDTLALAIAGEGDFALEDADGLTLTSVATGGNASFSTNDANLVVEGNLSVAGELSLLTLGGGDVVLPNAGLLHTGDLTIEADNLVADTIILGASNADITLRDGSLAQSWTTSFDRLVLAIAGAGDFSLTDTDGLTLTSVNTGGNASFRATAADLVLTSGPVVAGDLHLATLGSGDLVIPDAGLAHSGNLTLAVDRVRDSNADVSLAATDLTATLREHQQAATWTTNVHRLDLTVAGGGALTLANTGALAIDNLASDGRIIAGTAGDLTLGTLLGAADMAFSSDANLTLLSSSYDVSGELALTAANDLRLAAAGLTVTDTMRLVAAQLTVAGGAPVMLAGTGADLTLTGSQALALSARLGQLGLTYNGDSVAINNDRNLMIDRWDAPNAGTVSLSVNGTLTLPVAGLAANQRLNIDAVDLRDDDRTLSLSAPELAVRLSGASGNYNWTVNADSLDVLMRGQANLQVNAANGLVLEDLNSDTQAVLVENGNFTLNLASGDLTLANTVSAADLSADGVRAGVIDLAVAQGGVRTRGAASVISTNLVDQAASGDAIRIRLSDTSANDRDITLGDSGNSAVTLRAIGGDILLDSRAAGTATAAKRNVEQYAGVVIEAFNNPGDNLSGRVLINGGQVAAQPWQTVRAGRTLAIVTDVAPPPPPGSVLDELDDLDGSTEIIRDSDKSGPKAAAQFEQVFGTCDELDKKNRHRCRVDDALKSFLSHWLVGGELPPKTEIR